MKKFSVWTLIKLWKKDIKKIKFIKFCDFLLSKKYFFLANFSYFVAFEEKLIQKRVETTVPAVVTFTITRKLN